MADVEKHPATPTAHAVSKNNDDSNGVITPSSDDDLERDGEKSGAYALDASAVDASKGFRLAKDGRTVLIPQPSDDPHDPLNWNWGRKHLIVFVISACAFLPDYGSATGGVVLLVQSK